MCLKIESRGFCLSCLCLVFLFVCLKTEQLLWTNSSGSTLKTFVPVTCIALTAGNLTSNWLNPFKWKG